eukprot:UN10284
MNIKSSFMFFWSLSSGFGIIFAILSWIYDLYLQDHPHFSGFKGVISLFIGTIIGVVHYNLSNDVTVLNNYLPKQQSDKTIVPTQSETSTELQNLNIKATTTNNDGEIVLTPFTYPNPGIDSSHFTEL